MNHTKEEIERKTEELKNAYLEFLELDEQDTKIKIKKAKAQKRLSLARDEISSLRLN